MGREQQFQTAKLIEADTGSDSESSTFENPCLSSLRKRKAPVRKSSFQNTRQMYAGTTKTMVQFSQTGNSIKLIKKYSKSYLKSFWWTKEEMDKIADRDADVAALVEVQYERILRRAYKSCSDATTHSQVDLCLDFMTTCEVARGLEMEVFSGLYECRVRHRNAVLDAQDLFLDAVDSDTLVNMICKHSIKFSRASQLIAAKVAEVDQRQATEK